MFRKIRLIYEDETYALLLANLFGAQWVPFVRVSVVLRQTGKKIDATSWEKFHFMKTIDLLRRRGVALEGDLWQSLASSYCSALGTRGYVCHRVYFEASPEETAAGLADLA